MLSVLWQQTVGARTLQPDAQKGYRRGLAVLGMGGSPPCRGKCYLTEGAHKFHHNMYLMGHRYCRNCRIGYPPTSVGWRCPCCGNRLRAAPKRKKHPAVRAKIEVGRY